jgi:type II secretory pathway component GspD/PulD (secretin)
VTGLVKCLRCGHESPSVKIPLVGKAFRKSSGSTQNRFVMLLARPVLVQGQASKTKD